MEQATLTEEPKVKPESAMKNIDLTSKMSQNHNAPHKVDKAPKYNIYDKDTHPDG